MITLTSGYFLPFVLWSQSILEHFGSLKGKDIISRPNEFESIMTARKGNIKPQYYKEQGHTWLHKTVKDNKRSYKAT